MTNLWATFLLSYTTLSGDKLIEAAKQAFLYVVATMDAEKCSKGGILLFIVGRCPNLMMHIAPDETIFALHSLYVKKAKEGESLSFLEDTYLAPFVLVIMRKEVAKLIFRSMLVSSHFDEKRLNSYWTITAEEKKAEAEKFMAEKLVGNKRLAEVALEFGLPCEEQKEFYFAKLLRAGHYDQAEKLGVEDIDLTLDVIVEKMDAGEYKAADIIAHRFLPLAVCASQYVSRRGRGMIRRQEIIEEIRLLRAQLENQPVSIK